MGELKNTNESYLKIDITDDENFEEFNKIPSKNSEKKSPFEIEILAIKKEAQELDKIVAKLKDIKKTH